MKSKLIIIGLLLCLLLPITCVSAKELNNDTLDSQKADIEIQKEITTDNNIQTSQLNTEIEQKSSKTTANIQTSQLNTEIEQKSSKSSNHVKTSENENILTDSPNVDFKVIEDEIKNAAEGSTVTLNNNYIKTNVFVITIEKDLTIDGQGHTIDLNKNSGFYSSKGQITLKNLIMINCHEKRGGVIFITGSAEYTIINCTFMDNYVEDSGGVIYSAKDNPLTITDCKFINNHALNDLGGAIYSNGALTIENSYFNKNTAKLDGGAIYCLSTVDLINTTFISNKATGALIRSCYGGAICSKDDVYIEECEFLDNIADNRGGAIYSYKDVIVKYSSFTKNSAKEGGAIYGDDKHVIIDSSSFSNNEAKSGHGGAIYANKWTHIGSSSFERNVADSKGGAIYTTYIQFSTDGASFIDNSAKGHGGAIYTNTISNNVNNLYFEHNHADNDYGGAIYINSECGNIYFINSSFVNNYAIKGDGGAIYSDSGSTQIHLIACNFTKNYADGGITKRYGGAVRCKDNFYAEDCIFISNWAENYGGAIYTELLSSITNCLFDDNHAKEGGAIYINKASQTTIANSYFKSNHAYDGRGGAIYTDSKSTSLNLNNNAFYINTATGQGTDVFNSGNYKSISNNWWGTNNPSFSNRLKEYHTLGSNEDHSDSNKLRVSISGSNSGYVDLSIPLKVVFTGEVSNKLLNSIKFSSDKQGIFVDKIINGNSLEISYIPNENGNHNIKVEINSETLKFSTNVIKSSVYAKDLVKYYGDNKAFSATFKDSNGNYLADGSQVTFQIGNDEYNTQISSNGVAILREALNFEPGVYTVKSINKQTGESFINKITVLQRDAKYNINDTFIMRVSSNNGYVNNDTIIFKLDGKNHIVNISDGFAFLRLDVLPGLHTIEVFDDTTKIYNINITVLNSYSKSPYSLNGTTYGSLIPIYNNETFNIKGLTLSSVLGDNTYRYILPDGCGYILYNVTVSNNEEFTNALRKIASNNFKADIIIINLKNNVYKITESFYKDQEWDYLIHLTHGKLFINGNGATIDDGLKHNFMTIESGTSVIIENLNFKKFYRCFVNNGNLYCKNCLFEENDARSWQAETPGAVAYNKKEATFEKCVFNHNDNTRGGLASLSVYNYRSNLMAGVLYGETNSLTNFIECDFKTAYDTIHARDGSMVVIYEDGTETYEFLTERANNNFEIESFLDLRPANTFNLNETEENSYDDFKTFLNDYNDYYHNHYASDFVVNIKKGEYSIKMDDIQNYDFRTLYNSDVSPLSFFDNGENIHIHHRYLLDVGSRPILINGNGAKLTLTNTDSNDDNHFAFVSKYGTLTLINLTLSGFNTAIVNQGKLILINCTLTDNVVHYIYQKEESENGGAIRNYALVFCYNTTFTNNKATKGAVYYSKGAGAIGQFYNCIFKDNRLISKLIWKDTNINTLFLDNAIVKIIECEGIDKSNIEIDNDGLVLFRDELETSVLNFTVDDYASLMKLSKTIADNEDYDVFNVTFTKGDYGIFPNSKILFEIDYGVLIINGNGARIFVHNPNNNDETQFLVTTARSSVVINNLTIQGFNIAIENNGYLNMFNSNFTSNKVDYKKKEDYGGAIVNYNSLTISNSTFNNNYAKYGGAIYNKGNAHVIISNFINNWAYNSKSNIDIYNHEAAVEVVTLGQIPRITNDFPMAAWKRDVIESIITVGITLIAGSISYGISASGTVLAHFINLMVGSIVGAIGGTINGFIYCSDNQDYSEFSDKLFEGIATGLQAIGMGEGWRDIREPELITLETEKREAAFETLLDEFFEKGFDFIQERLSESEDDIYTNNAHQNNGYDNLLWYSYFKEWT